MQYLHVKNLEKYHPGYRDRRLTWCKAYFKMLNTDPDFELLCEIDKWRFLAFIMLELQLQKPIPLNDAWLTRKGFDLKKRPISKTLNMLQNCVELSQESLRNCNTDKEKEKEKDKEKEEEKDKDLYADFEKSALQTWNSFCDKYPILSKVIKLSDSRRTKLKKRFTEGLDMQQVIEHASKSKFLLGMGPSKWKISFDWIIENDKNHLKVIEGKYNDHSTEDDIRKKFGLKE